MNSLFWLFWVADVLLGIFTLLGANYRSSYGAGIDLNTILMIGIVLVLAGSLFARYGVKMQSLSVWIALLPIAGMVVWYFYDSAQN